MRSPNILNILKVLRVWLAQSWLLTAVLLAEQPGNEAPQDMKSRPVYISHHPHHAAAAVKDEPPADRCFFCAEEADRLFNLVLINFEGLPP